MNRLAQSRDELDVDVCFDERIAYLLDHAIESLLTEEEIDAFG